MHSQVNLTIEQNQYALPLMARLYLFHASTPLPKNEANALPLKAPSPYFLALTIEQGQNGSIISESSTLRVCQATVGSCIFSQHCIDGELCLVPSSAADPGITGEVAAIECPADDG
jgi:hypothetical protein